jgi:hypothetical protein
MTVVALVPIQSFRRLESALLGRAGLRFCAGAADVLTIFAGRGARALIVDPAHVTGSALFAVAEAAVSQGAALVAYCGLDPPTIRRLLELNERHPMEVVIPGGSDEAAVLARAIEPASGLTAASIVRYHLAAVLRRLPSPLNSAVLGLYCGLPIPHHSARLLSTDAKSRRTGERWLRRVGLHSATRLLKCARLARVWDVGRQQMSNETVLIERADYGSKRMLLDDFQHVVGRPFREARKELRTPEFSIIVAKAAFRQPGAPTG